MPSKQHQSAKNCTSITMKFLIVALALVAVAAAQKEIVIVRQAADISPEGSYSFGYETSNGISASEQGALKAAQNEEGAAISAQGRYAYTDAEGNKFEIKYVADENGFQPQGAHLPVAPTPPPVPEAILRAIEYIRTHPAKESSQ